MQSKVDALYVVGHVVKQHNCKLSWNIYLSLLIVHGSEAHNSQVCCVLGNTFSLWESFTNFNKIFYKRISVSLNGIGTKKWVDLFGLDFIISPSIWYKTNEVHGTSICLFPDTWLNKTVMRPRVDLWFWQLAQTPIACILNFIYYPANFGPKKKRSLLYPNHVLATTGKSCSKKKVAFAQIIKGGNVILGDFLG